MVPIRTPPKSTDGAKSPSKTGAAAVNVRRSIGELEANKVGPSPPLTSTTTQAGPAKIKARPELSQDHKLVTVRRPSVEIHTPPKQRYADRTAEAKACLYKAKTALNSSRNTKTDIKSSVFEAVDRLYQLVKEAERDTNKPRETKEPTKGLEPEPETSAVDATFLVNAGPGQIVAQLEEHTKLLLANNKMMRELKETMEKQKEIIEREKLNVNVTATQSSSQPQRSTLHSVVITSKNEKETGEQVLEKVRKTVDAKEGWVKVERVRKAKDSKVIMGFRTKEERNKVTDRLGKERTDLTVEEVKNKDPLLVLKDVLSANTDEDIKKAFRNQNRGIFHDLNDEEDRFEIRYRKRARNPHTGHIVISVSPTIWRRANETGYVHIDLQRIRVEDQSPLVQCTRCLGYGHGKRFCKEPADVCSHCGGPHLKTECAEWLAGAEPSCRNCTKAKLDTAEHNAFSPNCPIRQKWDKLARSAVAYC